MLCDFPWGQAREWIRHRLWRLWTSSRCRTVSGKRLCEDAPRSPFACRASCFYRVALRPTSSGAVSVTEPCLRKKRTAVFGSVCAVNRGGTRAGVVETATRDATPTCSSEDPAVSAPAAALRSQHRQCVDRRKGSFHLAPCSSRFLLDSSRFFLFASSISCAYAYCVKPFSEQARSGGWEAHLDLGHGPLHLTVHLCETIAVANTRTSWRFLQSLSEIPQGKKMRVLAALVLLAAAACLADEEMGPLPPGGNTLATAETFSATADSIGPVDEVISPKQHSKKAAKLGDDKDAVLLEAPPGAKASDLYTQEVTPPPDPVKIIASHRVLLCVAGVGRRGRITAGATPDQNAKCSQVLLSRGILDRTSAPL